MKINGRITNPEGFPGTLLGRDPMGALKAGMVYSIETSELGVLTLIPLGLATKPDIYKDLSGLLLEGKHLLTKQELGINEN